MAIVDSGPLVALFDRSDARHAWAVERFREMEAPLLVCEPVLTEVLFLLRRWPRAQRDVLQLLETGALRIAFSLAQEIEPVRQLMQKYSDVPMSLADACLVRMAEIHSDRGICTLDGDFLVYRKHAREAIPLIVPG